jgi:urease accessory protein
MRPPVRTAILATVLGALPAAALAHPGHPGHEAAGAWAGFAHPFTGADHMLAMVAVGLWAALRGGKALWAWPAAFVAALLAGFALGKTGLDLPLAEPMIMASIIVLGALTAANAKAPTALGVALIAAFGAAHGYAHGAESPGSTVGFPLGMALATLGLHGVGLAAGLGLQRLRQPNLIRLLGAGAAVGGLALAIAG